MLASENFSGGSAAKAKRAGPSSYRLTSTRAPWALQSPLIDVFRHSHQSRFMSQSRSRVFTASGTDKVGQSADPIAFSTGTSGITAQPVNANATQAVARQNRSGWSGLTVPPE
jgi:hypothetical protein